MFYSLRTATNAKQFQVGSLVVAEMLYRTNLVAMVAGGRKPKFADNTVLDTKEMKSRHDVHLLLVVQLLIYDTSSAFKH